MRSLVLFCFYLVCNTSVANVDFSINDFAEGIGLITNEQSAIYKLNLPEEVYRKTTKKDLTDIRVYNQNNDPVPHIIQGQNVYQLEENEILDVPFFPVHDEMEENQGDLDIIVSSEGRIVRLQSINEENNNKPDFYLIDVSHVGYPIDSLELDVAHDGSGYTRKIKLEYSDDLNHWATLVNQATVTELDYGGHKLKNNQIALPNKKTRYIRLSWLDDVNGLTVSGVRAHLRQNKHRNQYTWSDASLVNILRKPASYEFDTGGHFYINQLDIQFPETNTLVDIIIKSRNDKDSKWVRRSQGVFYKLSISNTELTSGPVSIRPVKDRYWLLELQSEDGIGNISPVFKYGWSKDKLYFLARGQGPFILAYGNANLDEQYTPPTSLKYIIQQDDKQEIVAEARLGQHVTMKGDSALEVQKKLPWQRILLWAILITGVIITAYMVYRLLKQMTVK